MIRANGRKNPYLSEYNKTHIYTGETHPMYGKKHSEETKNKLSLGKLSLWQNPDFVAKQMKAKGVTPNKTELWLEQFLNNLYPNEWKFVGDGQLIIAGKCPDFVNVNGQKKLIELWGDYWHKGENPQDRMDIFKKYGFSTLVIWGHELKDKDTVKNRIKYFMEVNRG